MYMRCTLCLQGTLLDKQTSSRCEHELAELVELVDKVTTRRTGMLKLCSVLNLAHFAVAEA